MTRIVSRHVQVPNGDLLIDAYLACPEDDQLRPGVIVVQEIFGVNVHIREVTERVAQLGYVAIAPAIYQRIAPGFEAGYAPEDITKGREYKVKTKASELLSDLQATVDYLYKLPQVAKTGVGSIGFCFGGHVTYLGATLPEIKATASFYGAGITDWCPGEERAATLEFTPEITGKIYLFFGDEDASIPGEQVAKIEASCKEHHIDHQVFCYLGAGHGFFCDRRASYHPEAAADAWDKVQQLFAETLTV